MLELEDACRAALAISTSWAKVPLSIDLPHRLHWRSSFSPLTYYLMIFLFFFFFFCLLIIPMRIRFLCETIQDYVLTPALLPRLLLASRTAIFPVKVPAPQGAEPGRAVQTSLPMHTPTSSAAEGGNTNITNKGNANTSSAENTGPSAPEIADIRRHCAVNILALIPRPVARRLFGAAHNSSNNNNRHIISIDNNEQLNGHGYNNGYSGHYNTTNDSQKRPESGPTAGGSGADREYGAEEDEDAVLVAAIENELLDLLQDEYCNKHLVYSIIETVLVRLVPELGERSVGELLEDRGVSFSDV